MASCGWATFFCESASNYHAQAINHYELSKKTLNMQYKTAFRPYLAGDYHTFSLLYPLSNSIHCIVNVARILKGVLSLGYALFNEPRTSPLVLYGMTREIGSLLLNLVTIVASIVNLVTKTLATIFNLGYAPVAGRSSSLPPGASLEAQAGAFAASANELKRVQEEQDLGILNLFRMPRN